MSDKLEFEIRKSSDIVRDFTLEFITKDPTAAAYVIASGSIKAFDGATEVTNDVIHDTNGVVSGNKLTFRVKGGTNGKVYLIKAKATMNDGQEESAWGTLIIVDPTAT